MKRGEHRLRVKWRKPLRPAKQPGQFAAYSMLGHKGDLMLVYFRDSFDDLNQAELVLNRTGLQEFLEPTTGTCR